MLQPVALQGTSQLSATKIIPTQPLHGNFGMETKRILSTTRKSRNVFLAGTVTTEHLERPDLPEPDQALESLRLPCRNGLTSARLSTTGHARASRPGSGKADTTFLVRTFCAASSAAGALLRPSIGCSPQLGRSIITPESGRYSSKSTHEREETCTGSPRLRRPRGVARASH